MCLKFGQFGPQTTELAASKKYNNRLMMGPKMVPRLFSYLRSIQNILTTLLAGSQVPFRLLVCCWLTFSLSHLYQKGPVSWYGKLTWESAHAWNLIILCTFVVLGMNTIIMVHLIFYVIPLSIYDVMYNITTKPEGTLL